MRETELTALRRDLARHSAAPGKRYAGELEERVAAWASGRREQGASWARIASELGLRFETVRRWCERRGSASSALATGARLMPVHVVATRREAPRTVSVVSPSGFRVEGLALLEAVAMLKALS